jgi:hypothetical protein
LEMIEVDRPAALAPGIHGLAQKGLRHRAVYRCHHPDTLDLLPEGRVEHRAQFHVLPLQGEIERRQLLGGRPGRSEVQMPLHPRHRQHRRTGRFLHRHIPGAEGTLGQPPRAVHLADEHRRRRPEYIAVQLARERDRRFLLAEHFEPEAAPGPWPRLQHRAFCGPLPATLGGGDTWRRDGQPDRSGKSGKRQRTVLDRVPARGLDARPIAESILDPVSDDDPEDAIAGGEKHNKRRRQDNEAPCYIGHARPQFL